MSNEELNEYSGPQRGPSKYIDEVIAQYERLGLNLEESPYTSMAGTVDGIKEHIEVLRTLAPGVTWWDVYPDIPSHWIPGKPKTWTYPYAPLGAYDYQSLPTGTAVHVYWDKHTGPAFLDALVAQARQLGFPIYGAGFIQIENAEWPSINAYVIVDRDAPRGAADDFAIWVDEQSDATLAGISRRSENDKDDWDDDDDERTSECTS